ncbi:MAG: hypothetical protein N2484_13575 [Clostridia bacterium]|nr:hypothetical protein [Clostridia bacterium]
MYIVSVFNYSLHLEMAITALEQEGIDNFRMLSIPLKPLGRNSKKLEQLTHSDGITPIDLSAIFATILMLFGVIYGYILAWGPILWGLIGFFSGALLGYLYHIFYKGGSNFPGSHPKHPNADVILLVNCDPLKADSVMHLLEVHNALGIGKYENKIS